MLPLVLPAESMILGLKIIEFLLVRRLDVLQLLLCSAQLGISDKTGIKKLKNEFPQLLTQSLHVLQGRQLLLEQSEQFAE